MSLLVALAAAGLQACGEPPSWTHLDALARECRIEDPLLELPSGRSARLVQENGAVRLELSLRAEDWEREPQVGFWLAPTELALTGGSHADPAGFGLASGEHAFLPAPAWTSVQDRGKGFPPGTFQVNYKGVLLRLRKDETPPPEMTLSVALQSGDDREGRVWGRRFSGRGFHLWPGQSLSVQAAIPEGAVLRFATTLEPLLADLGPTPEPTVFRVLQDEREIFSLSLPDPTRAESAWHRVVPARTGVTSRLTFTVTGGPALTCFMSPTLAPAECGSPGARPWDETRPDVLLFLADTFRADNMGAYGGRLELTPNLDRFASENLLFTRAWSVGTYTLPSHVSMFTGVLPYQAGLQTIGNALPEALVTIAEALSQAGYRTGAITDAGIVSRRFAFDQGFEFFDEKQIGIESTVQRALEFLDADDGRPTFLFVHSYRAHVPYEVSAATRAARPDLGVEGTYAELAARLEELARERGVTPRRGKYPPEFLRSEEAAGILAALRAQYLGGVVDVDRGFGAFLDGLGIRRWLEHGQLLFTSDHGEAFGEHGELEHGDKVFEAKIRIPLVLAGKGIAPGRVSRSASLVDITPTIAAMAGLPPDPGWVGRSLLGLERDRPVLSFGFDDDSTFSVIEGERKVIGTQHGGEVEDGNVVGAFDLDRDPHETTDLASPDVAWPAEMLRRYDDALRHALKPVVEASAAQLDEHDLEELQELGYGGR